jgi:hypothetical protein
MRGRGCPAPRWRLAGCRCSWVWFSYSLNQSSRPQQPGSSQQPFILNQAMLFSQLVRDGGGAGGVLCGGAHGLRCTGRAAGSAQNQSGCKRASATQMQRVGRHRAPSGWWCRARGGERAGGRVSLAGRGGGGIAAGGPTDNRASAPRRPLGCTSMRAVRTAQGHGLWLHGSQSPRRGGRGGGSRARRQHWGGNPGPRGVQRAARCAVWCPAGQRAHSTVRSAARW